MTVEPKALGYVPIPTKQEHRTHPGRTTESKTEREIRYNAQEIARYHDIPFSQALEIARQQAAEDEKARRKRQSREDREKRLKRERQHDLGKRDTTPVHVTHGPPMQGGAPGSGKRR